MGWHNILSLVSDNQVSVLIGVVILAMLIAITLVILEIKLKKNPKLLENIDPDQESLKNKIKHLKIVSELKESPSKKLESINIIAKQLFKKKLHKGYKEGYTELIKKFNRRNEPELASFCEIMMSAYYLPNELTNDAIKKIAEKLISILEKDIIKKPEHKSVLNTIVKKQEEKTLSPQENIEKRTESNFKTKEFFKKQLEKKENKNQVGRIEKQIPKKTIVLPKQIIPQIRTESKIKKFFNSLFKKRKSKDAVEEIEKQIPQKQIQKTLYEEENKQEKTKQEKLINTLNNIKRLKRNFIILKENPTLQKINKKNLNKNEYFREIIKQDPTLFVKVKKEYDNLSKLRNETNNIIREFYLSGSRLLKEDIKKIIDYGKKERIKIMAGSNNPIEQSIKDTLLAESALQKLKSITIFK